MRSAVSFGRVVVGVALIAASVQAQIPDVPIRISAVAVNLTAVRAVTTATVEITIDSWSSPSERTAIVEAGMKSPTALLDKLKSLPVRGKLRFPGWQGPDPNFYIAGWDLHYAAMEKTNGGGQRIVIATDRQQTLWERDSGSPTRDYPFTLLEIHLDAKGGGEGHALAATKIFFDKKTNEMVLQQFSDGPVALQKLSVEKKK